MASRLETETPSGLSQNATEYTNQDGLDSKNPPHGVDPKTYSFLLTAIDYNKNVRNIFNIINPDKLNLTLSYYREDLSLSDLARTDPNHRTSPTIRRSILTVLNTIWEQLPAQIRPPDSKEEVIKIKEDPNRSPAVARKRREASKTLWERSNEYREKTTQGIRNVWNRKHGIEENADPLTRRVELFIEWLRITTQELKRSPTSYDIDTLKKQGRTQFSITMYKKEFGDGSFTKAKEVLARLTTLTGPSFEAAQKLTGYLTSKSKELAKHGIPEEDVQKHNAQIKEARKKILSATSEKETSQKVESLDLLLIRIQRKISIMTPLSINKGRLRLQSDIL